ncbi:GDSL-type esterase/lipase family protein [Streptomyces rubiginosohelvolus]|uniref:GDSL-type esterase/lipase family protein n=1 Tax=Streptomyces rubiginosohelvolus TaxID=67362 RepID=UPI0033A9FEB6
MALGVIQALLATLMAIPFTVAVAAPAQAAPPAETPFLTWNMQGATAQGESLWSSYLPRILGESRSEVVMLQEAGAGVPGSARIFANPPGTENDQRVTYAEWHSDWYMVFLQTHDPQVPGGRVNTIVMSSTPVDAAMVVENPLGTVGRPAIGIRLGEDWYFSFHALSGGGGDAVGMLRAIGDAVERDGGNRNWTVGGDFNTTPGNLIARDRFPDITTPDMFLPRVVASGQPTHRHGSELDFAVTTTDHGSFDAHVRNNQGGSDHNPVHVVPVAARPDANQPQLATMPVGGHAVDGYNVAAEPFTYAGMRGPLDRCVIQSQAAPGGCRQWGRSLAAVAAVSKADAASFDYVGAVSRGNVEDDDNQMEAFPGKSIEELRRHLVEDLPVYKPNVILLQIDVANDLAKANGPTAAQEADQLKKLLDQIFAVVPNTTVLVGDPVPSRSAAVREEMFSGSGSYVSRVDSVVSAQRGAGRRAHQVPIAFGGDTRHVDTGESADGVPNAGGYRAMTDGYAIQLDALWKNGTIVEPDAVVVNAPGGGTGPGAPDPELGERDIRLMPLGDSITYGVESSDRNGYRNRLHGLLERSARSVDFVGSVRAGSMKDPDNEGHPGDRIDEIAPFAACSVKRYQPNLITLHAGTNDMNQNYQLASAPGRLKRMVDRALEDSPQATVLVAQLIPTGKAGLQPRIDAYNAALPGMVKDLQADGKRVVLVSMDRVTVADGLQNDAHPTDAGYAKMATAWYDGVKTAEDKGWIRKPSALEPDANCNAVDPGGSGETALGKGWRKLGVIAPGYGSGGGRTVMAEMNGDKRADYVQIRPDGSIRVGINTENKPGQPTWKNWGGGSGVFSPAGDATEPGLDSYVRFADIDGNGRDDYLVLLGSNDKVTLVDVWLNHPGSGDGPSWGEDMPRLRLPIENARLDRLRFADVNGDGRDDVLRLGETGEVHAYLNQRQSGALQPDWEEKLSWAPGVQGAKAEGLRFADVDNDNRADYLMVGGDGSVHAYLNRGGKGGGGFDKHHDFANASNYPRKYVQFSDISGDGKADYLVVYDGGAVRAWLNRGGNSNQIDPTPPGGGNEIDPTPPQGS